MKLSQITVEEWIKLTTGSFGVKDIWSELGISLPENKQHLRVILGRLESSGVIVKTTRDGVYRKVDLDAKVIDWKSCDTSKVLPLVLPFEIHKYCKIYPKSVIIVTADKNQGKTAFMYESLKLNMDSFPLKDGKPAVDLYNSETGVEQMKERFEPLNFPEPCPFNVFERYDNFSDVVHPEHLSLIDYLDFNSEVYLVGTEIDAIFRKLTKGCAIIALQKPAPFTTYQKGKKVVQSRDLAYGGSFSAKRASVYITMGQNKLKLLYVKSPANPKANPNNMMWSYSFGDTGYFTNIQRYYEYEDIEEVPDVYRGGE